jgi:uncharacterized protein involved in outer membrane biogenesis
MSLKWKIVGGSLLLVVLLIVGAFVFLDDIAKRVVEVGGASAMGVPVSLEKISLRPLRGEGDLAGLKVSNPEGFETPHFMKLAEGHSAVDTGSVFSDTIVVKSIRLEGLEVYLEAKDEGSNYEVILENMKKSEEAAPPPGEGGKEEGEAGPGKKFRADEIVVRDINVHADVAVRGKKLSRVDLRIPEIRLENVGSESGGSAVTSQVMGTIVKAVLRAVLEQGARVLPEVMVRGLGHGLKGVGKVTFKVVGKVTGTVGGKAIEVVGEAGKAVAKKIGGLFGGDDEEEKEEDK